jgi:hypothetical protein
MFKKDFSVQRNYQFFLLQVECSVDKKELLYLYQTGAEIGKN